MGKSSAQIDVQRAKDAGGGSSPFASRGRMHSIAGRPAGSTGGQQPQPRSIRDQQPRAAQQHSWLQRLRQGGGSQKPFVLFAEREFILLEFSVCSVELV